MIPIIDLNLQKRKSQKKHEDEEISPLGMLFLILYGIFMGVIFLCNICGGKFW